MRSREIRQSFLDFFAANGHRVVPSSSLVPIDDPTLKQAHTPASSCVRASRRVG
jgi:alanyl-tRNA synthetase